MFVDTLTEHTGPPDCEIESEPTIMLNLGVLGISRTTISCDFP